MPIKFEATDEPSCPSEISAADLELGEVYKLRVLLPRGGHIVEGWWVRGNYSLCSLDQAAHRSPFMWSSAGEMMEAPMVTVLAGPTSCTIKVGA